MSSINPSIPGLPVDFPSIYTSTSSNSNAVTDFVTKLPLCFCDRPVSNVKKLTQLTAVLDQTRHKTNHKMNYITGFDYFFLWHD
ncbi:hypothetical protein [Nostoc sp.]|uniref:hypothetical protein n=1 Tax=Nostoc sp. TaxID=1180 RepID=UPI002FF56DA9